MSKSKGRLSKLDSTDSDFSDSSVSDSDSNDESIHSDNNGQPLLLIRMESSDEDGALTLHLNEETLATVLETTKNRPLCIISTAGTVRMGKSFLLDYAIRGLVAMENDEVDWMDWGNKTKALTGFKWSHGMKPVTKGVWIWSRAFLVEGEDDDIAVLLLDTQGFDDDNSSKDISTIIGLCMLSSSTTILNFPDELPENIFRNLSTFLKFGLHCAENDDNDDDDATPFQKLSFLIRDWTNPTQHQFGIKGGKAYLTEKLQALQAGAKGKTGKEMKKIREAFKKCFKSVDCCLVPNIGDNALKQSSTGAAGDLSPEFAKVLETFINEIISSEGLPTKKILGAEVSAEEFKTFLPAYVNMLNSWNDGDLELTAKKIWEVTGNISHENIVKKSMLKFHEVIGKVRKNKTYLLNDDLEEGLADAKKQAQRIFKKANKLDEFQKTYERKLEKEIKDTFQSIKNENEKNRSGFVAECIQNGSDFFRNELDKKFPFVNQDCPSVEYIEFYDDGVIKAKANILVKSATETFTENFVDEADENLKALVKSLEGVLHSILESFLSRNGGNRATAEGIMQQTVDNLLKKYKQEMKEFVEEEGECVELPILKRFHIVTMRAAEKKYAKMNMPGSIEFKKHYETLLKNLMENAYSSLNSTQSSNIEEKLITANELLESQTKGYFDVLKSLAEEADSVEELLEKHESALPNLKRKFNSKNPFPEESSQREALNRKHDDQLKSIYDQIVQEGIVMKKKYQEKCQKAFEQGLKLYTESFARIFEEKDFLEEEELNTNYVTISNRAFENFEDLTKSSNEKHKIIAEEHMDTLTQTMQDKFEELEKNNDLAKERAVLSTANLISDLLKKYTEDIKQPSKVSKTLDHFTQKHKEVEKAIIETFIEKCSRKSKPFTDEHVEKLETEINLTFVEVKEIFDLRKHKDDMEVKAALEEVRKHYHNDMQIHFKNNEFMTPEELLKLHEIACKAAVANSARKTTLNESQRTRLEELLEESFVKYKKQNDLLLNWDPKVEPAIGIDLGTTYSCVAVFMKGKVTIIPNELGGNTTPSYVAFDENNAVTIGQPAKDNSYKNPENTVFDAKRIIGRALNDPVLKNDMKFWPFEVVPGDPDKPGPAINIRGKKYPPEGISSILLGHFKAMAEKFLNRTVKKAVITVPAYFSDGQRQATLDAGEIAGLEVLTILNEPTAAAIAYQLERFNEEARKILIFDLGGGTFDVAVLNMMPTGIEVLGVDGDTHLGGEDFDKKMMEHCAEEFKKHCAEEFKNLHQIEQPIAQQIDLFKDKDSENKTVKDAARQNLRRLQTYCEKSKRELAASPSSTVSVDALVDGKDLTVSFTRAKFEELNQALFQKAIDIVDRALATAKIRKELIDDVVLIGGSTKIRKVQQMLKEYFNGKALNHSIDADHAVGYGAAVQAALLNSPEAKKLLGIETIQDVTPMSYGISAIVDGIPDQFSIIIPKNTRFPTKHVEAYGTYRDNQPSVIVKIYQGEDPTASKNTLMGQFELEGIPPGPKGTEEIDITMEIDRMGILHVTGLCKSTRGSTSLTVTSNKGRLSTAAKKQLQDEQAQSSENS